MAFFSLIPSSFLREKEKPEPQKETRTQKSTHPAGMRASEVSFVMGSYLTITFPRMRAK